jgi:uncharacterized membrane protein (UPF0127 family)
MIFKHKYSASVFFVFAVFLFNACSQEKAQDKLSVQELVVTTTGGRNISINAELAKKPDELQRGLMFRTELKDGDAMLFVFESDRLLSFWMKNTIIPLSIAYINRDGVILEIHDMQPHNLNSVQSTRSLRFALEVPQGYFNRAGIAVGDRIDMSAINGKNK